MPIGLYIHVPFCRTRCHFCAFYLRIYRDDLAQAYVQALLKEIRLHAFRLTTRDTPLSTLYLGGGTPTLLPSDALIQILDVVRSELGVAPDAEITIEGTPDSVTEEGLHALKAAGFNRLSLGLETAVPDELVAIGRRRASDAIAESVGIARLAGFTNLNLDLIYGLPGQTERSWQASLDQALALNPTHVSTYALSVEAGSRFHVDSHRGDLPELDEALALRLEDIAIRCLTGSGLERYEISNYARPGSSCRHNRLYWEAGEYLGLGPSAQSYVREQRFSVMADLDHYIELLARGALPICDEQWLNPAQRGKDALVFGLRLLAGVDTQHRATRDAVEAAGPVLTRLKAEGWLEQEGTRLRLTDLGRQYADSVAVELL